MKHCSYREALTWASSLLNSSQINPKIAEWLQLHLAGSSRPEWLTVLDENMPAAQWETYQEWVGRVLDGEPYQYIVGTEDFYGRSFIVSPSVLIPRPETELLVENVLHKGKQELFPSAPCNIVDIGTGSGAIAITLDLEWQDAHLWATDLSADALQVARQNATALGAHVQFLQGNLAEPLIELGVQGPKFDILVSNPPYIPFEHKQSLARNVIDFEPHSALFAPEDGTFFYRKIIEQSRQVLASKGLIAFEVGIGQADHVVSLIKNTYPQAKCQVKKDFQGIERIVLAEIVH